MFELLNYPSYWKSHNICFNETAEFFFICKGSTCTESCIQLKKSIILTTQDIFCHFMKGLLMTLFMFQLPQMIMYWKVRMEPTFCAVFKTYL